MSIVLGRWFENIFCKNWILYIDLWVWFFFCTFFAFRKKKRRWFEDFTIFLSKTKVCWLSLASIIFKLIFCSSNLVTLLNFDGLEMLRNCCIYYNTIPLDSIYWWRLVWQTTFMFCFSNVADVKQWSPESAETVWIHFIFILILVKGLRL